MPSVCRRPDASRGLPLLDELIVVVVSALGHARVEEVGQGVEQRGALALYSGELVLQPLRLGRRRGHLLFELLCLIGLASLQERADLRRELLAHAKLRGDVKRELCIAALQLTNRLKRLQLLRWCAPAAQAVSNDVWRIADELCVERWDRLLRVSGGVERRGGPRAHKATDAAREAAYGRRARSRE